MVKRSKMGYIRHFVSAALVSWAVQSSVQAAELTPPSHYLVDLSDNHWCYACVSQVVDDYGLLNGFVDHTFRGDWEVNRYALAAAVAKTFNQLQLEHGIQMKGPLAETTQDPGVLPEHWAFPYVRKLSAENGLLSRYYAENNFEGDKVVTRGELAYGLSEFLEQLEKNSNWDFNPERRELELASDLSRKSPNARYIELALNRYRFMNLYADHSFRPEKPVTRYALAAALCRVMALFDSSVDMAHK